MAQYVALLRGINVGGKNLIGMPALKDCFEAQGFADVDPLSSAMSSKRRAPRRAGDLLKAGILPGR